jgi:hypothetical protein
MDKYDQHWWLTSVILATQQAEIRRITVQNQPRQIVCKTLSQKIALVEWLKVKALSSSPSTTKNKCGKLSEFCAVYMSLFYSHSK